jgi:hypothetical protein
LAIAIAVEVLSAAAQLKLSFPLLTAWQQRWRHAHLMVNARGSSHGGGNGHGTGNGYGGDDFDDRRSVGDSRNTKASVGAASLASGYDCYSRCSALRWVVFVVWVAVVGAAYFCNFALTMIERQLRADSH